MAERPDEFDRDLRRDSTEGQNYGLAGTGYEDRLASAYDFKDIHDLLPDWRDDELKQLMVVPEGAQLQQGATYYDLLNPQQGEFTARGDMVAGQDSRLVLKTEVGYDLWNKLTSTGARR